MGTRKPAEQERPKKGAGRMLQLGYKQIQVWLSAKEFEAVKQAFPAAPLAQLARRLLCEAAGFRLDAY